MTTARSRRPTRAGHDPARPRPSWCRTPAAPRRSRRRADRRGRRALHRHAQDLDFGDVDEGSARRTKTSLTATGRQDLRDDVIIVTATARSPAGRASRGRSQREAGVAVDGEAAGQQQRCGCAPAQYTKAVSSAASPSATMPRRRRPRRTGSRPAPARRRGARRAAPARRRASRNSAAMASSASWTPTMPRDRAPAATSGIAPSKPCAALQAAGASSRSAIERGTAPRQLWRAAARRHHVRAKVSPAPRP